MKKNETINRAFATFVFFLIALTGKGQVKSGLDMFLRDEATGEWLIGLFDEYAIYDSDFWDYAEVGKDRIVLVKDGQRKKVRLKKNTINIDGKKHKTSVLTTKFLPDYPTEDSRTGFVDNGYNITDSVTIKGWLRNWPNRGGNIGAFYEDIFIDEEEGTYVKTDSLGRFSITIPLFNSMEVRLDWDDKYCQTVLEPGNTYFFFCDHKTGQSFWMGNDVRLQNELLAHPAPGVWSNVHQTPFGKLDAMKFWALSDSLGRENQATLAQIIKEHPKLSRRYIDFKKGEYQTRQGCDMMQAQFYSPRFFLPKNYLDYVGREFWAKAIKPYTLYQQFSTLMDNYIDKHTRSEGIIDPLAIIKRLEKDGFSPKTSPEEMALDGSLFNLFQIIERIDMLDSLGCDQTIRDISLTGALLEMIDHDRNPLDSLSMLIAKKNIQMPSAFARVERLNNKYLAIRQRDITKLSSLKSASDVANLSDGEQILRKIIEPYKGRFVLLDIWGTWCGPCKEALSHSAEEYERLKDFDLVYLYLANNSSDEAWKNVIKEYDVVGDNVVHYNLPSRQQSAIEQFLNVHFWPHYRLIDRDGNILDEEVNPVNLEALARLLERLK